VRSTRRRAEVTGGLPEPRGVDGWNRYESDASSMETGARERLLPREMSAREINSSLPRTSQGYGPALTRLVGVYGPAAAGMWTSLWMVTTHRFPLRSHQIIRLRFRAPNRRAPCTHQHMNSLQLSTFTSTSCPNGLLSLPTFPGLRRPVGTSP
jgi:hypothetical protein